MEETKWRRRADILLCIVLGGGLVFFCVRYLLSLLLPFLIAWLLSLGVARPARAIAKRMHLSERLCAAVLFFLTLILLICLVSLAVGRLLGELKTLLERTVARYGSFEEMTQAWMGTLEGQVESMGLFAEGGAQTAFRARFYDMVSGMIAGALSGLAERIPVLAAGLFGALPSILLGAVVLVMAGFYFCIDRERITTAVTELLPEGIRRQIPRWRARGRRVSWQYVRAYLLLMLITFVCLLIGFLLLRVPYALLLAFIIALVDMLPVLGIGTVLLPWALILLLRGQRYLGFGLLILYGTCALVRQIAEPRLIGKSLGLHPLLSLLATYVGWRTAGLLGMLIAPIIALIAKSFFVQLAPAQESEKKGD